MLNAVLRIETDDAETIVSALKPEMGRELPRIQVSMDCDGKNVTITFDATDTSAMRAALNSYLGCIKITEDIEQITGD